MNIYPQDLGRRAYVGVLRHRQRMVIASGVADKVGSADESTSSSPPSLTRLRRFWMGGTKIDAETARHGQQVFDSGFGLIKFVLWFSGTLCTGLTGTAIILWLFGGHPMWPLLIDAEFAAILGLTLAAPRFGFRSSHRKLHIEEIEWLRAGTQDPLWLEYWELVGAAMRPEVAADAASATMLRTALHSLGVALEGLPLHMAEERGDAGKLRAEAETLAAEARREPDMVIAGSLTRQAEALRVRAETTARASLLLRRNLALRREISEQMNALRTSLTVLNLGGHAPDGLATLASGIQRIATETASLAAAHLELEAAAPPVQYEQAQAPLLRLLE